MHGRLLCLVVVADARPRQRWHGAHAPGSAAEGGRQAGQASAATSSVVGGIAVPAAGAFGRGHRAPRGSVRRGSVSFGIRDKKVVSYYL
jgi:hypothetical protein